jgi:membrane protein insertase Oxa1/YidC/SpoIIIJ
VSDTVNGSLTCRKILRHGSSRFTSHPRGRCAADFIALKYPSPRPGLNPRAWGPVASTLTTTPPRRFCFTLSNVFLVISFFSMFCFPFLLWNIRVVGFSIVVLIILIIIIIVLLWTLQACANQASPTLHTSEGRQ